MTETVLTLDEIVFRVHGGRLEKPRGEYDLDVDWRFVEIHPDHPAEGKPIEEPGYSRRL